MTAHIILLSIRCPRCGKRQIIRVPVLGYFKWQAGELIQDALPDLSVSDREALISGFCSPCFDYLFDEEGGYANA